MAMVKVIKIQSVFSLLPNSQNLDVAFNCHRTKGQVIWKANCQAMNSSKKGT